MTFRHGWIMIMIVGGLVLLAGIRLIPCRGLPRAACINPMGIEQAGKIKIVCGGVGQISRRALLKQVGLHGCFVHGGIRRGEMLRIGADCKMTRAPLPGAMLLVLGLPLDLNHASLSELILLPSIGPVLAARIIKDRREKGAFGSLDELLRVRGIGPHTIQRLQSLVEVINQN